MDNASSSLTAVMHLCCHGSCFPKDIVSRGYCFQAKCISFLQVNDSKRVGRFGCPALKPWRNKMGRGGGVLRVKK
jgi:hypothetical protein